MNDKWLLRKKERYQRGKDKIPQLTSVSYERAFEIEYTHNSTAIEGNTLTLMETKLILEDQISVGGKKLREIYEQVNHQKAFRYVKECSANHLMLDEKTVKEIHAMLMRNILEGGVYRNRDIYLSGAQYTPPSPKEMCCQLKDFYGALLWKGEQLKPMELAAWTHAEFVRIHPFPDGNGRISRLLMNYQLMAQGVLPISIAKENRLKYFDTLEAYALEKNLNPFAEMIAVLEEQQLDCYIGMIEQGEALDLGPQLL